MYLSERTGCLLGVSSDMTYSIYHVYYDPKTIACGQNCRSS